MKVDCIQVLTATEKKRDAEKLSRLLLQKRLAACVQIVPVESRYRWKGRIEKSKEYLCIIKSRRALYRKVEKAIKKSHLYEIPEIISVSITSGSRDYLSWIASETCVK